MVPFPGRPLSLSEVVVVADSDVLPSSLGVQHFDSHTGLDGLEDQGGLEKTNAGFGGTADLPARSSIAGRWS